MKAASSTQAMPDDHTALQADTLGFSLTQRVLGEAVVDSTSKHSGAAVVVCLCSCGEMGAGGTGC
jgi:hypothetical protein